MVKVASKIVLDFWTSLAVKFRDSSGDRAPYSRRSRLLGHLPELPHSNRRGPRNESCSISMKELVGLKTVLRDDGTRAIGHITWMQPGSNINQGPSQRTTRYFTSESINTQSSLQFL